MNAVEILNLTRRFSGRTAVDGLTLTVAEDETLALLGVNGAGKTTAIRALCGLIPADSGEIRVMGHPAGSESARACVGLSPQETAVAENLTVRENLELMGRLCGMSAAGAGRAARAQIESLSLEEVEKPAGGQAVRRVSAAAEHRDGAGRAAEGACPRRAYAWTGRARAAGTVVGHSRSARPDGHSADYALPGGGRAPR